MAITATAARRVFSYNGTDLVDPGEAMSVEEVKDVYSASFPELVNATIEGPTVKGDKIQYSFVRTAGAKG